MSILEQARRAIAKHGEWEYRVEPCRPAALTAARAALTQLVIESQRLGLTLHVDSDDERISVRVVSLPEVPEPDAADSLLAGGNPGT